MFQIVLSLVIGVFIGWNFHLFYISLSPENLIPQSLTLSKNYEPQPMEEAILPKTVLLSKEENISEKSEANLTTVPKKFLNLKLIDKRIIEKESNQKESNQINHVKSAYFQVLLKQNNFADAMAFYMEGTPEEIKAYKLILKVYFYDKASISLNETIEQLLQYIDIEPINLDFQLYLAKIYYENNEFTKSINYLFELQNSYHDKELQLITDKLNTTIEVYIKKLSDSKNISKLILFLEDIISKSSTPDKYIIQLAVLYKDLEIYDKAEEILSEINSDSTYNNRALSIIREIQIHQDENRLYQYIIPLNKVGSHFTVNLKINNIPLTLLLDTGATYTFIDTDKIPDLEEGEEILLNTAGGKITGESYLAETLTLQNLELTNFQIIVAPFKEQSTDGLLGMNFFQKFNFKIDQERAVLYLGNN